MPASHFSHNGLSHITQQGVKCKDGLFATAAEELEALEGRVGLASCYSQPGIRDSLATWMALHRALTLGPRKVFTHIVGVMYSEEYVYFSFLFPTVVFPSSQIGLSLFMPYTPTTPPPMQVREQDSHLRNQNSPLMTHPS